MSKLVWGVRAVLNIAVVVVFVVGRKLSENALALKNGVLRVATVIRSKVLGAKPLAAKTEVLALIFPAMANANC